MKRKTSNLPAFIGIGLAVVGVSLAAGYYLTGNHSGSGAPAAPATAPPVNAPAETAPNPAPVNPRPVAAAGKYVAPGAPPVTIAELPVSTVSDKTATTPDPESSQTGAPPTSVPTVAPPPAPVTVPPTTAPQPTQTPTSPPAQPAASGSAAPTPPTVITPTEANDDDSTDPSASSTSAIYCVEAGTFASEKNAKTLVDSLNKLGFQAGVVPGDSDNSSFRVQVGAYHSKATADNAVATLQRQGYPAYILTK